MHSHTLSSRDSKDLMATATNQMTESQTWMTGKLPESKTSAAAPQHARKILSATPGVSTMRMELATSSNPKRSL